MKKSLGMIRQGDQSVVQKIKAKCEAKDKDKNSTYDTYANTKSSRTFRGKKTNNSSAHAYSETSLGSQVLCDLSYKDASILKTNTSKGATHPEKATSLVNIQILSTRGSKAPIQDTEKIFEDKPREAHEPEDAQFSLSNEIDQALEYLNKNKNLPGVLAEQDKKVQNLKAKLCQVYQEIEQLKLWQKRKSIPVMIQNLYLPDQRSSARGDWDKDQMTKLKNLSPPFPLGTLEKGNRYKMYEENPTKTLVSSFVKNKSSSKISRESIKPLYIGNMKKKLDKPLQSGRNVWSIEEESKLKFAQSNRDYMPAPTTITSTKTAKILKEKLHAGSSNISEQRKIESSYLGNLIDRHIAKMGNTKEPERDIAKDYNSLFEKYVDLIQQYKSEVKELTVKNLDLQKIKEQNEKAKTD